MRGFIVGLLVVLLFLSACSPAKQVDQISDEVECVSPLIRSGSDCCLDADSNFICDKDEINEVYEEEVKEDIRVKAGSRVLIKESDLPMTIFMQRDTRILYTVDGVEEVFILRDLNKFRITFHYENERFKIDERRSLPIGSLLIKFEGVDPPKGGNQAKLFLQPFYS